MSGCCPIPAGVDPAGREAEVGASRHTSALRAERTAASGVSASGCSSRRRRHGSPRASLRGCRWRSPTGPRLIAICRPTACLRPTSSMRLWTSSRVTPDGGGPYGAALGVSRRRRARSRLRAHRRGGTHVLHDDPVVLAARRPDTGADRGRVLPRSVLRADLRALRLPAAPLVRLVRDKRSRPAHRGAARPRRAVYPRPGRGRAARLLDLHDDAQRPRVLPVHAHRRPYRRRPEVYVRLPKVHADETRPKA